MAISTNLTTTEGQLRLEIGDNRDAPDGVRPGGENYDNAVLQFIYEQEGGTWDTPNAQAIGRAAARCFELLSIEWGRVPKSERLGPASQTVETWRVFERKASEYRKRYGGGSQKANTSYQSGRVQVIRNDS